VCQCEVGGYDQMLGSLKMFRASERSDFLNLNEDDVVIDSLMNVIR
jgi:hypothetical protein